MKIGYFDCIAGASGDMILGALIDAGLPEASLRERLDLLHLDGFDLKVRRVHKNAFTATKVDVIVADEVPERHLADIIQVVAESELAESIKAQAIGIFRRMGEVEAGIHGTSLDHVHLHELGGMDTIIDVVGALVGLDALGVEHVVVSPIPLGRGTIRGAHGMIPLPAPTTIALLREAPIVGSPFEVETVTPTAAAILSTLAADYGSIPAMTLEAVGYGAGTRDMPIPNVLRLLLGHTTPPSIRKHHSHAGIHEHPHSHSHEHSHHDHDDHAHNHGAHQHPHDTEPEVTLPASHEHSHPHDQAHDEHAHTMHSCLDTDYLSVLETNIDDLNPEFYEHVMARLFEAGALDVFLAPIQMKKNRPATLLRVLCRPNDVAPLTTILFAETSTLGVREHRVDRHAVPRTVHEVATVYGAVHVKVAHLGEGAFKSAPEYEDCRVLANAHGVPLREIYLAASAAAQQEFGG